MARDEGATWFAKAHERIPANYHRSKLIGVRIRQLSGTLAIASGIELKYDASDHELERSGSTYVLRKTSPGWRIAALLRHDAINAIG
jgi:hypothetical protein